MSRVDGARLRLNDGDGDKTKHAGTSTTPSDTIEMEEKEEVTEEDGRVREAVCGEVNGGDGEEGRGKEGGGDELGLVLPWPWGREWAKVGDWDREKAEGGHDACELGRTVLACACASSSCGERCTCRGVAAELCGFVYTCGASGRVYTDGRGVSESATDRTARRRDDLYLSLAASSFIRGPDTKRRS